MTIAQNYHRMARLAPAVVMMFIIGCSDSSTPLGPGSSNDLPNSPVSPSGLRAEQNSPSISEATATGKLTLTWMDNSFNERGFYVERSAGVTDPWIQLGSVGPNVIRFEDNGLEYERTYYYRVRAFNEHGLSEYSNEVSAKAHKIPNPPVK